jgi:arylsulfatase
LSKVGMPGADMGLSDDDPTIAKLLKEQGYSRSSAVGVWV